MLDDIDSNKDAKPQTIQKTIKLRFKKLLNLVYTTPKSRLNHPGHSKKA